MILNLRWVQQILIAIIALGQAHFCEPIYELPSGKACLACPTLSHPPATISVIAEDHGDCHDCCELRACNGHENQELDTTAFGQVIQVAVLPSHLIVISGDRLISRSKVAVHIDSVPINGPPADRLSRGPPHPTNLSLSAGHGFVAFSG